MVRALFDVDVLLDVIEERQPQVEASSEPGSCTSELS